MQLKGHGQLGIHGTPAMVHVIAMPEGTEQGILQGETCLVLEVHLKREIVQVCSHSKSKMNNLANTVIQLKVHGHPGVLGALVWELVTVMQNKKRKGILLAALCLVQDLKPIEKTASVCPY